MLHKKHFTVTEAQSLLYQILPQLERMVHLKEKLDAMNFNIYEHQYFGGRGYNGTGKIPPELEELIFLVKDLSDRNVIIKDIDTGLIDFPAIRTNGDEVYLCYQLGESEIQYWHKIEDGFRGRRPLSEL
ncbi:MAG: DUF2203 domain-containing protein [Ignavibacteria bacterium]